MKENGNCLGHSDFGMKRSTTTKNETKIKAKGT
jgi:hypothetical protein